MDLESHRQQAVRKPDVTSSARFRVAAGGRKIAFVGLALAAGMIICMPCRAADSVVDPNLPKLEMKLFQHEYAKDSVEARLDRLEEMIYGESKNGSPDERIKNLLSVVSNVDKPAAESDAPGSGSGAVAGGEPEQGAPGQSRKHAERSPAGEAQAPDSSKYPAVTAIENRMFGKDFSGEPVTKRLERLETKVFGHPSGIDDLSERVDRLKQRTGIDIAKQAPLGTDWADDEDDLNAPTTSMASPAAGGGEDGRSFSGRDLRKDLGADRGITDQWAGTGSYGMGGAVPPGRAPVAQGNDRGVEGMPPQMVPGGAGYLPPPQTANQSLGLNQQVGALEQEIFGKTYVRDPLPTRLGRLEQTVFPQQKPAVDKALPDRVARLLSVVPLSRGAQPQRSIAQGGKNRQLDPDFGDLDDLNSMQNLQGQPRPGSGLSKIIDSIGSFLSGGYTGGYPTAPPGVMTDPQTGLWLDPRTGSLIDPITGAVVGQRAMQQPGLGNSMNGFGSFGNGFSQFGTAPYGTGYGTGMHFGFGGIGRTGYGMWP